MLLFALIGFASTLKMGFQFFFDRDLVPNRLPVLASTIASDSSLSQSTRAAERRRVAPLYHLAVCHSEADRAHEESVLKKLQTEQDTRCRGVAKDQLVKVTGSTGGYCQGNVRERMEFPVDTSMANQMLKEKLFHKQTLLNLGCVHMRVFFFFEFEIAVFFCPCGVCMLGEAMALGTNI